MKTLKHIGKLKNTGAKVLVVFRTLPGESNQALILPVAQLPDAYHDSIMDLVESDQAQDSFELGEIMFIRLFPDGRPMLQAMQVDNRLIKMSTDKIIMIPAPAKEIPLDELNLLIAEQKNVSVDDLYTFVKGAPKKVESSIENVVSVNDMSEPVVDPDVPSSLRTQLSETEVLTDKDLARNYRSQADSMYKEAARLRRQADELDPPIKKTTKIKEDASA
jgi:hypothetical protein